MKIHRLIVNDNRLPEYENRLTEYKNNVPVFRSVWSQDHDHNFIVQACLVDIISGSVILFPGIATRKLTQGYPIL